LNVGLDAPSWIQWLPSGGAIALSPTLPRRLICWGHYLHPSDRGLLQIVAIVHRVAWDSVDTLCPRQSGNGPRFHQLRHELVGVRSQSSI